MADARPGKGRVAKDSDSPMAGSNPILYLYREMLEDAASSSPASFSEEGRVVKRRRIGGRVIVSGGHDSEQSSVPAEDTDTDKGLSEKEKCKQQTAYNDSDDFTGSDMDWEQVDLGKNPVGEDMEESDREDKPMDLVLDLKGSTSPRRSIRRRKASTAEEKRMRLEVHKTHLLCLLAHVHLRNHWCNDVEVQASLKSLLTKRTVSFLDPDEDKSQFQRSRSFMDGLAQANEQWRTKFKVTARGLRRPYWAETTETLKDYSLPADMDQPLEKSDFRALAVKFSGSRDIGAQLYCALLRSVDVEARLVCSLQPLSFTAAVRSITPPKLKPDIIVAGFDSWPATSDEDSGVDVQQDAAPFGPTTNSTTNSMASLVPRRPTRLGQPTFAAGLDANRGKPPPVRRQKQIRIRESAYPVFWVEAFNKAVQKWVPVDPLVTNTVAKPSKLEPPASDAENALSYVIAFEEDGSVRDVTKRYAKAYNAKTRRARVEVTKGGERWWRRAMRIYRRGWDLDRDQVEDAELVAKEAAEEMPRNVQDFKAHPHYALERHLKRNEVIHPRREVGKVGAGKSVSGGASKALEPIYRRRDVHHVKSADGWYRLGREIKPGEQPLRRVQARRQRPISVNEDGDEEIDEGGRAGTGLYASFQTIPYEAPPVVNRRVPKNAYGNLDVYVPSMVPRGGVHLPYPEAARAAKIIGADYADAVTGFEFKGRHGTAIIKGIVVAVEYRKALEEVIKGLRDEQAQAEEARRTLEALRMWRRFMAGLRVRERIDGYEIEGERDAVQVEMDEAVEEMEKNDDGGGFLPDIDQEEAEPTAGRFQLRQDLVFEDEAGGFMSENADEDPYAEEALRYTAASQELHRIDEAGPLPESDDEGGFIPDDEPHDGGGFLVGDEGGTMTTPPGGSMTRGDLGIGHGLADVELAEGIMLQRFYEEGNFLPSDNGGAGGFLAEELEQNTTEASRHMEKATTQARLDEEREEDKPMDTSVTIGEILQEHQSPQDAEEEGDDEGSLLSHDPEDEDADPAWLASDQE